MKSGLWLNEYATKTFDSNYLARIDGTRGVWVSTEQTRYNLDFETCWDVSRIRVSFDKCVYVMPHALLNWDS